ncbi:MAG: ATP-dependent helicase [Lachnospiraceae bacterium]|nr:ATP-dependent helicase [Lachnospiraceae bacterium]
MNLNKEQYKAAVHVNGPMLVLAGPGSGKTHLLVERIQMMIEKAGIPPESILVITFSKKAAAQMQARFERRTEGCMYPVTFGTFHAVFFNILKDYDPDTSRLITEEEAERFAEHLKRSYDIFEDDTEPGEIIGLISSYRNLSDDFFTRNDRGREIDEPEREAFIKLAGEYAMLCKNAGVIDFDDMILKCRDLFCRHEAFLRKWKKRYRYFLVDEFQDINDGQYELLRLLAGDEMNVFAVGDDDQSIYSFRGARPGLMKKFMHQYTGCRRVNLTMNYRCCENIIGAADTVVRHNRDRIERPLQRHLPSKSGGIVEILNFENSEVQAAFICDKITGLINECGYRENDFAVLFRSDHCAKLFEQTASGRGFELKISGRCGYVPKETRIHEAYIRAKEGAASRADWFLIMNNPPRGLSREALYDPGNDYIGAFKKYYAQDPDMLKVVHGLEDSVRNYDITYSPSVKDQPHRAINVMTAHASKGLEFKCVFIIGLQEGLFPHHKSIRAGFVEEERRLMYVAMTRARERLYMCTIGTSHGKRISRFAQEAYGGGKRFITDVSWITR